MAWKERIGADEPWEAVQFEPFIATTAVQLRIFQMFTATAENWQPSGQHKDAEGNPRRLKVTELARELQDADEKVIGKSKSNIDSTVVSKLWTNFYGIRAHVGATLPLMRIAKRLVDETFTPVLSASTSAATAEMAKPMMELHQHKPHERVEALIAFRDRYEGLIEPLRAIASQSIDIGTLVAQYDEWIVYLTDLVAHAGLEGKIPADKRLSAVLTKSRQSGAALRRLSEQLAPSPVVEHYRFQRLTNELQDRCVEASMQQQSSADIEEMIEKTDYFGKLDRFLEIVEGRRFDEAMHGLVVATTIGSKEKMLRYGEKLTRALRHALNVAVKEAPWDHSVLRLEQALIVGDPAPLEIPHLKSYFDKKYHEAVLEKLRSLKPNAKDPEYERKPKAAKGVSDNDGDGESLDGDL